MYDTIRPVPGLAANGLRNLARFVVSVARENAAHCNDPFIIGELDVNRRALGNVCASDNSAFRYQA